VKILHNTPTCENLPPTSDDLSCVKINPRRNSNDKIKKYRNEFCFYLVSVSPSTSPIFRRLLTFLLSIFIPIIVIGLLLVFFYYCFYNRLLCSSREKSSQLFNRHRHQVVSICGNSLSEIPFANIRFLEQIGEGK
jgi:hypothetical protein